MVSQAFKEPTNLILMVAVFGLLLILAAMMFRLTIAEEVCLSVVDKVTPSFMEAVPENIRPLKVLCRALLR